MSQAILDMFPDKVADFGLLGCGVFVVVIVAIAMAPVAAAIFVRDR